MYNLTEPIIIYDFYFIDSTNAERFSNGAMPDFSDNFLAAFLFVRNTLPFLPSSVSEELSSVCEKLDSFLEKDKDYTSRQFSTFTPEKIYSTATDLLNTGLTILNDFGDLFLDLLRKYNPDLHELLIAALKDVHNFERWDLTVKQLILPLIAAGYYIYQQWEQYSKDCLIYASIAVKMKRNNLELEDLARSADTTPFNNYEDYQQRIESLRHQEQKPSFSDNEIGNIVQNGIVQLFTSDTVLNNISLLHSFHDALQKSRRKTERFAYHEKEYSFGYFDEKGTFNYTGHMNTLALILHEVPMKGWSSCADKAELFVQHIGIKGKVSTLRRNLESVVSRKTDFTKASYHNEAVELFTAIIKNCE